MLLFENTPWNYDDTDRRYNQFIASGHTRSEYGVSVLLARFCEWIIQRSSARIDLRYENVSTTWLCIDHLIPGAKLRVGEGKSIHFALQALSAYSAEPYPMDRRNDLFCCSISLFNPANCPFYSDDRTVFAPWLLGKVHRAWIESWNLRQIVDGTPKPKPKWPVKLWIHKEPDRIWEIREDEVLVPLPADPRIDESLIELEPIIHEVKGNGSD